MSTGDFFARLSWGPRPETPHQLAARLLKAAEGIGAIDPLFKQWHTVSYEEVFQPLGTTVDSLAERIAVHVGTSQYGRPDPREGYSLTVYNFGEPKWTPRSFSITMHAGANMNWGGNSVGFATSDMCDPDSSVVSFALFKKAILTLAEEFDASTGDVSSSALMELWRKDPEIPRRGAAWITYLGPRFAQFADPPPSAIIERRPNGGLLMAATDEVFSTDDPEHMAVSRDIQAACAPFNALKRPYPGLEWPEA